MKPSSFVPIWLGIGAIAIGVKFPTYWNQTVFFPAIPNLLDTVWLSLTGGYLLLFGLAKLADEHPPLQLGSIWRNPLFATIAMIAITVLLAIVLYLMIAHLVLVTP